jgi:hypothetical protein
MIIISSLLVGCLIFLFLFDRTDSQIERLPEVEIRDVKRAATPSVEICVKGPLSNKSENVTFTIYISDGTEAEKCEIASEVGQLNDDKTVISIKSPVMRLAKNQNWDSWTKIITLPIDKIKLARSGKRSLVFGIQVDEQPVCMECTYLYTLKDKGFLDVRERLQDIYTAIFYMVSGFQKTFSSKDATGKLITEWVQEEGKIWGEKDQKDIAKQFSRIVETGTLKMTWEDSCKNYSLAIRKYADDAIRMRMLGLFFQAMDSLGSALEESEKIKIMYQLSWATGSDMGLFCRLSEKTFPDSFMEMPAEYRLGLHEGMTQKARDMQLRNEYKVWNSRISNNNKKLRVRSKAMLDLIASTRSQSTAS